MSRIRKEQSVRAFLRDPGSGPAATRHQSFRPRDLTRTDCRAGPRWPPRRAVHLNTFPQTLCGSGYLLMGCGYYQQNGTFPIAQRRRNPGPAFPLES